MTEFRKVIQCPKCRFANRLGEKRCIICKAELPQTAEPAAPSPADLRGPPNTNAAAAARAAAAKPPPGVVRKLVDPTKPPPPAATSQTKRPDPVTSVRPAADASLLADPEPPPKPLTKRVTRPGAAADAIAWLWCDPLPPIPLVPGKTVIVGRVDSCDLVLPHKEVSRSHAVFKISGKQITLEDQGSSNGCYINGKRSASHIVKVGDQIQIGPYEIELRATGEAGSGGDKLNETKSFDLTAVNSSGAGASMTGKLSDVPLVEILQGIEFNEKTCTLAISDGKLKGQIVFATGRPMTATFGGERDTDAVRAMLRLKEGRFVLSNEIDATEQTMSLTVTALLLEASREIDEAAGAAQAEYGEEGVGAEPPSADAYGDSGRYADFSKTAEADPAPPDEAPPE